jgi:hypothetical protein
VAIVVWLVAGTGLGGILLARHVVALPTPAAADAQLRSAVTGVLPARTWRAIHVMYRWCKCSQRTIDHLVARRSAPGVGELVLMVDDEGQPSADDARLVAAGFAVRVITPDELRARYHVEAVPVLLIADPAGDVKYVGGYNRRKQSPRYEDLAILADVMARHRSEPLPVFGCATSARLARALDPLGLTGATPR